MNRVATEFAVELAISTLRDKAWLLQLQGYSSLADDYQSSAEDLDTLLDEMKQAVDISELQIMAPLHAEGN